MKLALIAMTIAVQLFLPFGASVIGSSAVAEHDAVGAVAAVSGSTSATEVTADVGPEETTCCASADECAGHCLASYVVEDKSIAGLLPLLFILLVAAATVVTFSAARVLPTVPKFWHPPRYLFTTVWLLE